VRERLEEGDGRIVGLHLEPRAAQEKLERLTHRFVVVDHVDRAFSRHR
jgi:hypothetical protein